MNSRIDDSVRQSFRLILFLKTRFFFAVFFLGIIFGIVSENKAQTSDDCLACHEDSELSTGEGKSKVSLFVDPDLFTRSIHADIECVGCHVDLEDVEDFPHEENLQTVDCSVCHDDVSEIYEQSIHGKAVQDGEQLAPHCWDCHGKHDIVESSADGSRVAKFNIPFMCGGCHKEGSPITRNYDIPQDSILSHYSLSIHGIGLFKQGLSVTAVCSDCHTAHMILPHTDSMSSIHRDNVTNTCRNCHGQIEKVHLKVIKGELWEQEPAKIPVCVDCHPPHEMRGSYFTKGIADEGCMSCHSNRELTVIRDSVEVSLWVDTTELSNSEHSKKSCAQCHTGVTPSIDRPCSTVANKVDCSICHAEIVATHASSTHGQILERGGPNAPECHDCHGTHGVKSRLDPESPTFPTNVPTLCGSCHRKGSPAAERYTGKQHNIIQNYVMSIHGKGLLESGLVVTAMCTDCHTAHHELPSNDSNSSVNRKNIPETCGKCHNGIYEQYKRSIHYAKFNMADPNAPNCDDCHQAHTVKRTDKEGFKMEMTEQCGRCHEDVTESYFETFHGKVSKLGYTQAAKCYDCHGSHTILPPDDSNSTLSKQNIVNTCGQCHEGSHRQFAGYLTHATHNDRDKYPILYYTFWFMTILLLGTLVVAGTHTLLWLPRSIQAMKEHKRIRKITNGRLEFQRFKPYQRRLHILVVVSFLGLALTGMTLKFSHLYWAQWLSSLMGGFDTAGDIHRLCAVITFFYFFTHLFFLWFEKRKEHKSWKQVLLGPESMLPNKNDLIEVIGTLKWFVGAGPRPKYGRWTYWEKFDYFAVFWGVVIIGSTGLILWFPVFFTHFLPGWMINVATIIHSDEALLAVAFIFTVHFFNTHLRPDKFPMDTVIFTGRVPIEELRNERPREYSELLKSGKLKKHLVEPLPAPIVRGMRVFGSVALILGISLILLIIYAEVIGYW